MALCNCDVGISFTIFGKPTTTTIIDTLTPSGEFDGHTYYQFVDNGVNYMLYWESGAWVFARQQGIMWELLATYNGTGSCPGTEPTFSDLGWTINSFDLQAIGTSVNNCVVPEVQDTSMCDNTFVLNAYCKHATWSVDYVNKIKTGSTCLDSLHQKNIIISSLIKVLERNILTCENKCLTNDELCLVYSQIVKLTGDCNCK